MLRLIGEKGAIRSIHLFGPLRNNNKIKILKGLL